MAKKNGPMPHNVAKRVMRHAATSKEPIVLTIRDGKPSRVFGYGQYQRMVQLPHQVKPWEHRKGHEPGPDPLGAIDAEPPSPLTRDSMYQE